MTRLLWVPCGEVKPLNSLIGTETECRVNTARREWLTGCYAGGLFSGGSPMPSYVQSVSGARIMRRNFFDFLESHQRDHAIPLWHTEEMSWDSFTNIEYSLPILDYEFGLRDVETIAIPTHITHFNRMEITFRSHGFDRLTYIDPGYDLTEQQLKWERFLYRVHQIDPKGNVIGRGFRSLIAAQKMFGSGRT